MAKILVTGIGLVTPLGNGKELTWKNLLRGASGIQLVTMPQPFNAPVPVARVNWSAQNPLPRVQGFMQQAVGEAIADAQLESFLPECGVVIGSSRSYQAQIEELLANPAPSNLLSKWLEILPSHLAAVIATQVQSQSTVLAPMAACATANWAIAQACELIQTRQCPMVIVGASDAPITPLGIIGFQRLGAMAKTGAYPFSTDREGLVLGEGAAALILESQDHAQARGCQFSYGQVLGFGLSNDAKHMTSPTTNHETAAIAIKQCLERAHLDIRNVDFVSTHGTATQLNDAAEAALLQNLLPHQPFISATKGATGHALGATGMMEAAFCLLALQQQLLPPCINLRSPAFALNFIRAATPAAIRVALNLSFGFGGQNAVVAFGKV